MQNCEVVQVFFFLLSHTHLAIPNLLLVTDYVTTSVLLLIMFIADMSCQWCVHLHCIDEIGTWHFSEILKSVLKSCAASVFPALCSFWCIYHVWCTGCFQVQMWQHTLSLDLYTHWHDKIQLYNNYPDVPLYCTLPAKITVVLRQPIPHSCICPSKEKCHIVCSYIPTPLDLAPHIYTARIMIVWPYVAYQSSVDPRCRLSASGIHRG